MIELRTEIAVQMVSQLAALGDGDLAIIDAAGSSVALTGEWSPDDLRRFGLQVQQSRHVCEAPLGGLTSESRRGRSTVCLIGLPLVVGDRPVGAIVIRGSRRRARAAVRYLEALADPLARQLTADSDQQPEELRSRFLERVLGGDHAEDSEALVREAAAMGIDLTVARAALVVEIAPRRTAAEGFSGVGVGGPHLVSGQHRIIRQIQSAFSPTEHALVGQLGDGRIVVLCGVDPATVDHQLADAAQRILNVTDSFGTTVRVGVGSYWPDLPGIEQSFQEALQALNTGTRLRLRGPIYTLSDMSVGIFLGDADAATKVALARRLLDGLDSDLIETVRALLDANLSVSGSAQKLYLHRHTMLYRLDKLKQLTKRDARRFWDVLPLALALTLLRLTSAEREGKG